MSKENVEIVRRAYDAMGRQDLDSFLALHDPECVIALLAGSILALADLPECYRENMVSKRAGSPSERARF
jgi:ketosteroid isomerase-like protein